MGQSGLTADVSRTSGYDPGGDIHMESSWGGPNLQREWETLSRYRQAERARQINQNPSWAMVRASIATAGPVSSGGTNTSWYRRWDPSYAEGSTLTVKVNVTRSPRARAAPSTSPQPTETPPMLLGGTNRPSSIWTAGKPTL